jgi:hypothetical protein
MAIISPLGGSCAWDENTVVEVTRVRQKALVKMGYEQIVSLILALRIRCEKDGASELSTGAAGNVNAVEDNGMMSDARKMGHINCVASPFFRVGLRSDLSF